MRKSINFIVNERLDEIEFKFIHSNKNYLIKSKKFEELKLKLESILSEDIKQSVEELIDAQIDKDILLKNEIYKKAFKDGLTMKDYL